MVLQHPAELRQALERGFRPRSEWRLGLEYEQFVTDPAGLPWPYRGAHGVGAMLERLRQRSGWEALMEGPHLLGLKAADGRSLSLEPGAQIEFGSTPCVDLAALAAEVAQYMGHLDALEQEFDCRFVTLGAHPTSAPDEIERIPKQRYDILEPYLRDAGELGLWMMKATAGVQVNFDHADEADAMLKLRTVFALAPVFNALFANSSVKAGQLSGYASWRGHVWTRTDDARCGIVPSLSRDGSTFDDYIQWVLDLPMLYVYRDGAQVDMRGRSFRQFFESGEATRDDWEQHLSTPFPEVRFRPQLELRCADTQCPLLALALAALVQGVFYDQTSLQKAWELTADWSHEERLQCWHAAHRDGLAGVLPERHRGRGRTQLKDLAAELIGLARLSPADAVFLEPLHEMLAAGRSEGELSAELFAGEWQGDITRLIDFARCTVVSADSSGS